MTVPSAPGARVRGRAHLLPMGALMLAVALACGGSERPAPVPPPEVGPDGSWPETVVSADAKVPVTVQPDELGVLATEGTTQADVERFAAGAGARVLQSHPHNVYVLKLRDRLEPLELLELATILRQRDPRLIEQVGVVLRPDETEDARMIMTDEVIVQFREATDRRARQDLVAALGARVVEANPFVPHQLLVKLEKSAEVDALSASRAFEQDAAVEFAHPNYVIPVVYRQVVPNDALFNNQWHHQNTGQAAGTADADIDSPFAWALTTGAANVIIAVIDSGFETNHPDLTPNLWANVNEVAGDNNDNDNNGFIDDVNGWDFTLNGPNVAVGRHGTAVAGSAAAAGNNNLGVAGTCQQCQLMLLRNGNSTFRRSQAFNYAQAMGASIISNSWGFAIGTPVPVALQNAINAAANNGRNGLGAVVFWAMNNPSNNDCIGATPDISALANVIAVSRATNQDQFNAGGFGACMDVLGPTHGGTLAVTTTDRQGANGYNNLNPPVIGCPSAEPGPPPNNARDYTLCFNGTSAATPIVAGVGGLVLSVAPNLTRLQVQQLLQDTADRVEDSQGAYAEATGFSTPAGGAATTHGFGRVNAAEAVETAAPAAHDGVDVFIRDNRLDWGNTEQQSNVLFESPRGFIAHWRSVDIKVDAPPFEAAPTTSAQFDAFVNEDPIEQTTNRVYVRVHNRGFTSADNVTVKLHWAFAGTALPPLPTDFWTAFPADSTDTTKWKPIGSQTVNNLAYSGSSVAGGAGDPSPILQYDWQTPAVDTSQASPRHHCLFAVLDSPQDGVDPASTATLVVDDITPNDNNATHRNVALQDSTDGRSVREAFFVRNPYREAIRSILRIDAPRGWETRLEGLPVGEPFALDPGQEVLVQLETQPPRKGATGDVTVTQLHLGAGPEGRRARPLGGLTFRFAPASMGKDDKAAAAR